MAITTTKYRGYGIDFYVLGDLPIYSVTIYTKYGVISPAFRTELEAQRFIDDLKSKEEN